MSFPFLELRESPTAVEVFINGIRSFSLPSADDLKAQLLEAIADSPNAELEACIKDLSFAYRVGNASWNGEELIELVLRTREFSKQLSDQNHPLVASLIGLIAEVCPEVEKIEFGDGVPQSKAESKPTPKPVNPASSRIQSLLSTGRIFEAFMEAARWSDNATFAALLTANPDWVNAKTELGNSILMVAAHNGNLEAVESLIGSGADVNARDPKKGWSPLMWLLAAIHSEKVYLSVAKALIDAGADVSIRGIYGETALQLAKQRKSRKLIELIESQIP
jgi:hypothetical protein